MRRSNKRRSGRRGKLLAIIVLITGAVGVLLHFEQLAVLSMASGVGLIILVLLAVQSKLEGAAIHASEEAFMTGKSKDILPSDVVLSRDGSAVAGPRSGRSGPPRTK